MNKKQSDFISFLQFFFLILGPNLPHWKGRRVWRTGIELVASPGKEHVYSIGGYYARNKVFKLHCRDDKIQNCEWKLEARLKHSRWASVAMTVPDDFVDKVCN